MSADALLLAALQYARRGWRVFPCGPNKAPLIGKDQGGHGLRDATIDEAVIGGWWARYPNALIGLQTGAESCVWVLDIDVADGKPGPASLSDLEDVHGRLPGTAEVLTARGGRHLYFRYPADGRRVVSRVSVAPGLDSRGDGGYVIAPPSSSAIGAWEWEASSDPFDGVAVADAPEWLLAMVCAPVGGVSAPVSAPVRRRGREDRALVESALAALVPEEYDLWVRVGMALYVSGEAWGFDVWCAWSARSSKYPGPDAMAVKWASFARGGHGRTVGMGSVIKLAQAAGWEAPAPVRSTGPEPPVIPPSDGHDGGAGGGDDGALPVIRVVAGELHVAVQAAEQALVKADVQVFQHGTQLARVVIWDQPDDGPKYLQRRAGAPSLIEVGPYWLMSQLCAHAQWERFDKRSDDWQRIDAPKKVVDTLLQCHGEWTFRRLLGFVECPTMTPEGRIIDKEGYDADTSLYLTATLKMKRIQLNESNALSEAAEACGELSRLVSTFPFVSAADRSAMFALLMTSVLRRLLPAAPLFGISASTPATGKSLLADVASVIATGRPSAVLGLGPDETETEKRIDSVLMAGDQFINIDNVSRSVRSDVLCQVMTQPFRTSRVLQKSQKVESPTNVTWVMTGNNLTILGDLIRRTLMIHLDAGVERPEERVFARDALAHAMQHRAQAVRAILVIAKGYVVAGRPDVACGPYGGFGAWDMLIRRALIWAGEPDPLAPAMGLREQDHELVAVRDFLTAWWAIYRDAPVTAKTVVDDARAEVGSVGIHTELRYPELSESMMMMLGSIRRGEEGQKLGYRLRAHRDRWFGAFRVVQHRERTSAGVLWRVEARQ